MASVEVNGEPIEVTDAEKERFDDLVAATVADVTAIAIVTGEIEDEAVTAPTPAS